MTQQEYEQYLKEHDCSKCPAWSGTDCTRNPYEDGCLDPVVEAYWKEHRQCVEGNNKRCFKLEGREVKRK